MLGTKKWVTFAVVLVALLLAVLLSGLGLLFPAVHSQIRLERIGAAIGLATALFVAFLSISGYLKKRKIKKTRND